MQQTLEITSADRTESRCFPDSKIALIFARNRRGKWLRADVARFLVQFSLYAVVLGSLLWLLFG